VPRSFYEALTYFLKASKLGNSEALLGLGNVFFEGRGVEKNKKFSIAFFRSSGKRDNMKGMFNSAFMEKRGIGYNPNTLKALHSFKKLETIIKKRKQKTKNYKKSKFSKNFYRFLRKPTEFGLLKCYVNSLSPSRYLSFPGIILKKAKKICSLIGLWNRSSNLCSYQSTWNLGEILLENRQYFLCSKKIQEIFDFYPEKKNFLQVFQNPKKNHFVTRLLLMGDSIFNNNKKLHTHILMFGGFFSRLFFSVFSINYYLFISTGIDNIFIFSVFFKILVFPFIE
jgi:hypothetical protein